MKPYKLVAAQIERFNNADYVKACVFLEIQDLEASDDLIDAFVEEAYNWWLNSDSISAEQIGYAIYMGYINIDDEFKTDFDAVISLGLDGL